MIKSFTFAISDNPLSDKLALDLFKVDVTQFLKLHDKSGKEYECSLWKMLGMGLKLVKPDRYLYRGVLYGYNKSGIKYSLAHYLFEREYLPVFGPVYVVLYVAYNSKLVPEPLEMLRKINDKDIMFAEIEIERDRVSYKLLMNDEKVRQKFLKVLQERISREFNVVVSKGDDGLWFKYMGVRVRVNDRGEIDFKLPATVGALKGFEYEKFEEMRAKLEEMIRRLKRYVWVDG